MAIGDRVHVSPTVSYIDDGQACEIVTVATLEPGDVMLGWNGEPFVLGTVDKVERVAWPSYSQFGPTYRWIITADGREGNPLVSGDSPRRIKARVS